MTWTQLIHKQDGQTEIEVGTPRQQLSGGAVSLLKGTSSLARSTAEVAHGESEEEKQE